MTPIQLSSVLRHIAAKIDNSKNPSRTAVSAELLRILHRIAGRVDVINAVDHAFNAKGTYPPFMKQTGPNTYEGEIDTGWDLKVVENSPGMMDVYLNGSIRKNLDDAVDAYVKKSHRMTYEQFINSSRMISFFPDGEKRQYSMKLVKEDWDMKKVWYDFTIEFTELPDPTVPPFIMSPFTIEYMGSIEETGVGISPVQIDPDPNSVEIDTDFIDYLHIKVHKLIQSNS